MILSWKDRKAYCSDHIAWIRCVWRPQSWLYPPGWYCPVCKVAAYAYSPEPPKEEKEKEVA